VAFEGVRQFALAMVMQLRRPRFGGLVARVIERDITIRAQLKSQPNCHGFSAVSQTRAVDLPFFFASEILMMQVKTHMSHMNARPSLLLSSTVIAFACQPQNEHRSLSFRIG